MPNRHAPAPSHHSHLDGHECPQLLHVPEHLPLLHLVTLRRQRSIQAGCAAEAFELQALSSRAGLFVSSAFRIPSSTIPWTLSAQSLPDPATCPTNPHAPGSLRCPCPRACRRHTCHGGRCRPAHMTARLRRRVMACTCIRPALAHGHPALAHPLSTSQGNMFPCQSPPLRSSEAGPMPQPSHTACCCC